MPLTEVLLPFRANCIFAEPDWPFLTGTCCRLFLIGLFKSEFIPPLLFSPVKGMGTPRAPFPFLPEETSREAERGFLELSMVAILLGELERTKFYEVRVKLSYGAFACLPGEFGLPFFELERLLVMSATPVIMRWASCSPLPIMLMAGAVPIVALRCWGLLWEE